MVVEDFSWGGRGVARLGHVSETSEAETLHCHLTWQFLPRYTAYTLLEGEEGAYETQPRPDTLALIPPKGSRKATIMELGPERPSFLGSLIPK